MGGVSAIEHEFQVGDAIQFKDWQELIDEFGDPIKVPVLFTKAMDYLCGQVAHIRSINVGSPSFITTVEGIENDTLHDREYIITTAMIKPYEECETEEVDADSFISILQL